MWEELRYSLRALVRARFVLAFTIVTLALGTGFTVATFALLNRILVGPLPFEDAERLVMIWEQRPTQGRERNPVSPADFYDWRERARGFARLAGYSTSGANLTGGDEPLRVQAASVSAQFFDLLRIEAEAGRVFAATEESPGDDAVVLIGHRLWARRFGAEPSVLGRYIEIEGAERRVVGIMPPGFDYPSESEIWLPLALRADERSRTSHYLLVIGRLRPGVTLEASRARMSAIAERLQQEHPRANRGHLARTVSLREELLGGAKAGALLLFIASGFVLLIACANVGVIWLIRGVRRERQTSISMALGATRLRLLCRNLIEAGMVSIAAGVMGIVIARVFYRRLAHAVEVWPHARNPDWDSVTIAFALIVSIGSALLFAAISTFRGSTSLGSLVSGGRTTHSASVHGANKILVITEVALAFTLLLFGGLLVESLNRVLAVDPGFRAENVVTAHIALSRSTYPEPHQRIGFYAQILERIESLPGVRSIGATNILPLSGQEAGRFFTIEGRSVPDSGTAPNARYRTVSPRFFATIDIDVVEGRTFRESDSSGSTPVVVINETLRKLYWQDRQAIGERIRFGSTGSWHTVVGVVADVRHSSLEAEPNPELYLSLGQAAPAAIHLVVRSRFRSDAQELGPVLRKIVRSVDSSQPVAGIESFSEVRDRSIAQRRQLTSISAFLAIVALLLASGGIYAVLAYSTQQRQREMAIRSACGARWSELMQLVVKEGMTLVTIGAAVALIGYLVATPVLSRFLYGVTPFDAPTILTGLITLFAIAFGAAYAPALRAARTPPTAALRAE